MEIVAEAGGQAWQLIVAGDSHLYQIVGLSLMVSLSATLCAALIALPLAAILAVADFRAKGWLAALINSLLGLPPVVVGLVVYLLLSRAGPLGSWGLLFTPAAMILAQTILICPIVMAVALRTLDDRYRELLPQFRCFHLPLPWVVQSLLYECRFALVTAVCAGLGRAIAEVGAVMIVGGNIDGVTRVMTTAIALETSKGDLALALALGAILMLLALSLNALAGGVHYLAQRQSGANLSRYRRAV